MTSPDIRFSTPPSNKNGFALIIALMMMAFVWLLLICTASLIRIDTVNSHNSLIQLRAKENARLALMMALGDLQQHAAFDARVTARAEILKDPDDATNRFWTGVWDTDNPGSSPIWLVSGMHHGLVDSTAASTTTGSTLQLVGAGSASEHPVQHVFAPAISIQNNHSPFADQIAWWISDEGVKASVARVPFNHSPAPNFLAGNAELALHLLSASVHGIEELFSHYDRFMSDAATRIDTLLSLPQLSILNGFENPNNWLFDAEVPYHALTTASYGVLASTRPGQEGGLLQDLSLFPSLLGSAFETYMRIGAEHAERLESGSGIEGMRLFTSFREIAMDQLEDGDIAVPIAPILSNFMIAFTLRAESGHPNIHLRSRFFCELWNPYTNGFLMEGETGAPIHFELEITGLPEVRMIEVPDEDAPDEPPPPPLSSGPVNLQNVMAEPGHPENAVVIRLINNPEEPWLPGRTKNWVGLNTTDSPVQSPYVSTVTDSKRWNLNEHTLGGEAGIDTGIASISGRIRHLSDDPHLLGIKLYAVSGSPVVRRLLATLEGLEYEPVSTRESGYDPRHRAMTFGYHFILRDSHSSDNDPEYFRGLWLHDHDPRNPKPRFNYGWHLDVDPSAETGSPYVPVIRGSEPLANPLPQALHGTFNHNHTISSVAFERLLDRSRGTSGYFYKLWQDSPLFELPRHRILSLGSLQHLYFHNERPFQVGNSWGSSGNINTSAWFDRYFFSGLNRSDDPDDWIPDAPLPNPTLTIRTNNDFPTAFSTWQSTSPDNAAAARAPAHHILVAGRFNLNSTSIAAWTAVLGSLRLNDWSYLEYPEDTEDLAALTITQADRPASFTRFSQSLAETYAAPPTPSFEGLDEVAPTAFYRHGARRLTSIQIEALATEIVRLVKRRGRPFDSMEEFLSVKPGQTNSLMEQAIAYALAPDGRQKWDHAWEVHGHSEPSDILDIDYFSPGYLTQADVMTAIGPILAPRSDTFKIRARGDARALTGGTLAIAVIEATFQRIPEPTDVHDFSDGPTNRKFKLTSLRWLTEDEI